MSQDSLNEIGKCSFSAIREMVAALNCDYDRLTELIDERQEIVDRCSTEDDDEESRAECLAAQEELAEWDEDNSEELAGLKDAAGECKDADDARQRIEEDPLSIEYRSDWSTSKDDLEASEVRILLTTGGPAVQIIAELCDGDISSPQLQVQDWGTPWTEYYEQGITNTLLDYCRVFCFE